MKFWHKNFKNRNNGRIYLNQTILKTVTEHKYLGVIFDSIDNNKCDINRALLSFYKQSNVVLRKFYYCNLDVLLFLFKSYCMSWYGCELWWDTKGCKGLIRQCSVAYHNALKKICSVSRMESNHDLCEFLDMFTFNHFLNYRPICFYLSIKNFKSRCIQPLKSYFNYNSIFINDVETFSREIYDTRQEDAFGVILA